ncbi:MAG: hypothetical protein LIO79_10460 [Rikenellaceae bacterium]|nr:hypothetical protein [Rikenellaceae bacterium]
MKKILCFMALACLMCSCGIPKEREVTVSDVPITGFIKDYVKVVDGTYKFTHSEREAFISIKLELTDHPEVQYGTKNHAKIKLNPIGNNEEVFDMGSDGFFASDYELKKVEELLNGEIGETKTILFKWKYFGLKSSKSIANLIFAKAVSFELIDNGFIEGESTGNLSTTRASSGSSEWDKVLDDYEKYIDQYIRLYKKAVNGDVSAMSEYVSMLEKAESLGDKLDKAKGNMTTAQLNRYTQISAKLLNSLKN